MCNVACWLVLKKILFLFVIKEHKSATWNLVARHWSSTIVALAHHHLSCYCPIIATLSCLSPLLVTPSINYNMQLQVMPSMFCPIPCFLVSFCLWNKRKSKKRRKTKKKEKENKNRRTKNSKEEFFIFFTFRFYSVFWILKEDFFFLFLYFIFWIFFSFIFLF